MKNNPSTNGARHTPGPWKAVVAAYNPPGWLWVQNGPGALLADVHQNANIPLEARNANARLMAAAPALLEIAWRACDFLEMNGTARLALVEDARAAVAQSLGGE